MGQAVNDHLDGYRHGYEVGYAAGRDGGLTRAREAVAALSEVAGWTGELAIIRKQTALAAIDALREKP